MSWPFWQWKEQCSPSSSMIRTCFIRNYGNFGQNKTTKIYEKNLNSSVTVQCGEKPPWRKKLNEPKKIEKPIGRVCSRVGFWVFQPHRLISNFHYKNNMIHQIFVFNWQPSSRASSEGLYQRRSVERFSWCRLFLDTFDQLRSDLMDLNEIQVWSDLVVFDWFRSVLVNVSRLESDGSDSVGFCCLHHCFMVKFKCLWWGSVLVVVGSFLINFGQVW